MGTKARALAARFDTCTAQMDPPDVVVGSSFGAAVAVALLHDRGRGAWRGPTVLLAQAALRLPELGPRARLPEGVPVWIVHGTRDELVPIDDSRALAATGTPALV